MTTTEFQVTGMSCGHCERAIRDEVEAIAGVTVVEVDAATGHLSVTTETAASDASVDVSADANASAISASAIGAAVISAVDEAGYSAVPR